MPTKVNMNQLTQFVMGEIGNEEEPITELKKKQVEWVIKTAFNKAAKEYSLSAIVAHFEGERENS